MADTLSQLTDLARRDAVRLVRASWMSRGSGSSPADLFAELHPESFNGPAIRQWQDAVSKSAVPSMSDATPYLPQALARPLIGAFPTGVVDRLVGAGAVRVPFNVAVPVAGTEFSAAFVPSGETKPLSAAAFSSETLRRGVCVSLTVISRELFKLMSPAADAAIATMLSRAVSRGLDAAFGSSTGAVLDGVTPTAAGATPAADLAALVAEYVAAGGNLDSALYITSAANAVGARLSGHDAFRDLGARGGTAAGIATLCSDAVGANVLLVDAAKLLIADDGEMGVSASGSSSILMDDGSSPPATSVVSMFQSNQVALRAERLINWSRAGAVAYVANRAYAA